MKIVVCGGHHNSALVVAEALQKKDFEIYWLGHKYSMIGDKNPSAEYLEVTEKKIHFIEIKAGKFQPQYKFLINALRIPIGFWQSFKALLKIKPKLIVSFGGYLALPVATMGYILGIPIVTHEQTTVSGWANKAIAQVAKKIFVSFPSSAKYFPPEKVIVTGLPLRDSLFNKGKKLFSNSKETIYITGGKQGAHVINQAAFAILPELLEKYNVIHQCGSTSIYSDFQQAEQLKCSLGELGKNYLCKEYFFDPEIGQIYNSADFVVSRAGAHTIYELAILKKPAILIPIPWSIGNEQQKNAELLASFGLAKILFQADLESGKLYVTIQDFSESLNDYYLKKSFSLPTNATETIVEEINHFYTEK